MISTSFTHSRWDFPASYCATGRALHTDGHSKKYKEIMITKLPASVTLSDSLNLVLFEIYGIHWKMHCKINS